MVLYIWCCLNVFGMQYQIAHSLLLYQLVTMYNIHCRKTRSNFASSFIWPVYVLGCSSERERASGVMF